MAENNFIYRNVIGGVRLTTGILFDSVHVYFPDGEKRIKDPHPSILFANHVMEKDITALSHVYKYLDPESRFSFAARQDILEPYFLTNNFGLKGFNGFLLRLIDLTNVIPFLLKYIGAIPVKRPFRDDARDLIKKGLLRDIVEEQWNHLVAKLREGRNIFLFPEGTFTPDGWIGPVRKGLFLLNNSVKDASFLYFNFTYDFLSSKKTILHIGMGEPFQITEEMNEAELNQLAREKLGKHFVLNTGNLISFALFQDEFKKGIKIDSFLNILNQFIEKLKKKKIAYMQENITGELLKNVFTTILEKGQKAGYLSKKDDSLVISPEISLNNFKNGRILRRKNPFLFQYNQLRSFEKELVIEWKSCF